MAPRRKKTWLNSGPGSDQADERAGYWNRMSASVQDGTFWADQVKRKRGDPEARLRIALDNLPVPGAFREGCVAARMLVRKFGAETSEGLEMIQLIYWLAAVESLMLDYAPVLQEPGFNVMQSIPGTVVRALPFSYEELGCDKLRLLNKTDKKWLLELHGPPTVHRTLNELHRPVWDAYEVALVAKRRKDDEELFGEVHVAAPKLSRPWWKFWG